MAAECAGFEVAAPSPAEFGREEITHAGHEMPGPTAIRGEPAGPRPPAGARVTGFPYMTARTAVLIGTPAALGARVRRAPRDIFPVQDHAAAAVAVGPDGAPGDPRDVPVLARTRSARSRPRSAPSGPSTSA